MRRFHDRRSPRPRPRLHLEALEDRRLLSGGGLLSALAPAAVAPLVQAALPSPVSVAPATTSSGVAELLAGPVQAAVQSVAQPLTTGAVSAVTAPLAAVDVLAVSAVPTVGSAPAAGAAGAVNLGVSLNTTLGDVAAVTIGVGVSAAAPDQPIVSVGVAAIADVGSSTGGLLSVAPDLSAAAGGSDLVSVQTGTSVSSPSSSSDGGTTSNPPATNTSLLDALLRAPLSLLSSLTTTVADVGALLDGSGQQGGGSSDSGAPSGTAGGVDPSVSLLGVTVDLSLPVAPNPSSGSGATTSLLDGVSLSDPASVSSPASVVVGATGTTDAVDGSTRGAAPAADGGGTSQAPDAATTSADSRVVATPGQVSESLAALAAETATGASATPATAPAAAAPVLRTADGGGDGVVNSGAAAPADAPSPAALSGAGAGAVAPPAVARPADGAGSATPPADLTPDSSGLATRFQPFGPGQAPQGLLQLAHRIAPPGSWLAGLLGHLAEWVPWLAGLVLGGAAYEIHRRRRAALRGARAMIDGVDHPPGAEPDPVVTVQDKGSKERRGLAPAGGASSEERALDLAARLAEDLAAAWRRGDWPRAEEFLDVAPDLANFGPAALVLVREEVRCRREHGPPPDLEEYRRRFPQWADQLPPLFDSHSSDSRAADEFFFPSCGETVGDCRLLAELGRGAQGRVFLAAQTSLADRLVVLKMGPRDCHEHLALARLLHAHIVPLHFVQDLPVHNLRVLCMPYLGGATLGQLRDELEPIPPAARTGRGLLEALDRIQASRPAAAATEGPARARLAGFAYAEALCWVGACLADALQYAHERNMLHLDLKPSNVLLAGDGQPLLLDFHLARPPLPAGAIPPGWFGGTPGYMSPEQRLALDAVRARKPIPVRLDPRSDIYCLGIVLFEMLGGSPAPRALKAAGRSLLRANRAVSPGLADIVARCVEVDPRRRYQEAGALAADLRRHLAHEPLAGAPNRSLAERWRKWRRRRPHALAKAGLLLFLAALFAAGAGLAWAYFDRQRQDAEAALAAGEDLLRRGLPAEADRSLERGEELAGRGLWSGSLAHRLADARRRARRAQLAQELHRTADELRFRYDADGSAPEAAARLAAACARFWDMRDELLADADSPEQKQIRTDLRDLALLRVGLLDRTTGAGPETTRGQELAMLDEAEKLFGPSAASQYERERRGAAPSRPIPPTTAWEHYALGRVLLHDGKVEEAAGELHEAVRLDPGQFWPNFYGGVCAYRLAGYAEAEAAFRVCKALFPDCAYCYYNHGLAEAALKRDGDARDDYDRALGLDPNLADAWLNRGVLNYREKRWNEALNDLAQALAHGADPAAVHYDRALTQRDRGDVDAALDEARTTLRLRPDHAGAKELLADLRRPHSE